MHDLATQDILYEKNVNRATTLMFMGSNEVVAKIPEKVYSTELMVDEIILTFRLRKDEGPWLYEIRKHMHEKRGKFNIEYKSDVELFFDFSTGRVKHPEPSYGVLTIEQGSIPYGFLSKYMQSIISIEVVFVKSMYRNIGSTLLHRNSHVSYTKPVSLFPYNERDMYFDKDMRRPFREVFTPKTNKEAKRQARLESIED